MNCQIKCKDCPDTVRAVCKQVHNPKPYLNKQEQEYLWVVSALKATIDDVVKNIKQRRNDIENWRTIRHLELANKHIEKALDCMVQDLPWDKVTEYAKRLDKKAFVIVDK